MTKTDFSEMFATINSTVPYIRALGALFDGADEEGVTMRLPFRDDLVGDRDTRILASGVVTALLDHCCGMAVWHAMNAYQPIATLDLRIDYMRPAAPASDLIVTANCFKITRSVAFVRAFAFDTTSEDPVAAAQSAFMISSPTTRVSARP